MNKVTLIGRLTKDPEEVDTSRSNNMATSTICHFSVALDRKKAKNKMDEPVADFVQVTAFGKTADFVLKYFHKGERIAVDGSIRTGSYVKKDGTKVYTFDVIANEVEFCERKREEQ